MAEGIKRGDLVCVVRPAKCGCIGPSIGMIRTVTWIVSGKMAHCTVCGLRGRLGIAAELDGASPSSLPWTIELHRLKRIDPLAEPASTARDLPEKEGV